MKSTTKRSKLQIEKQILKTLHEMRISKGFKLLRLLDKLAELKTERRNWHGSPSIY